MNKEQLKQLLLENLTLEVERHEPTFHTCPNYVISIKFDGEYITSDMLEIPNDDC